MIFLVLWLTSKSNRSVLKNRKIEIIFLPPDAGDGTFDEGPAPV